MAAAAPSPALAPPPGNPRFPLLDPMRAFAAIAIVLTHASGVTAFNTDNPLGAYTARLNFGVTLFFLLSGFLLYRPFVAARGLGSRPPLPAVRIRDYARRRVVRIVPAYWVALTVLAIYPGLVAFWHGPWWRSYDFTQIYWGSSTVQGIFPAWTLCVEVTFYVALPFLAAAIGRIAGRSWVRELACLAALAGTSLVLRTALQAAGGSYVLQNTLACFLDWFCVGMALAVASVVLEGREQLLRRAWIAWAGAAVVFWFVATQCGLSRGFYFVYTNKSYLAEHVLYAAAATLLLLPAIFGSGGAIRRALAWRPFAWLGLVSYGIFLYHGPIVLKLSQLHADGWLPGSGFLSMVLVALAITIPCAALSYYLVERPALRFKERPPSGSSASARAAAAPASAPDPAAATARQAAALSGSSAATSRASGSA